MSDSSQTSNYASSDRSPALPRAIIHKQILDAAAASPDASLGEIANQVSGASIDLVDRVIDRYGDPSIPDSDPEESLDSEDALDVESDLLDREVESDRAVESTIEDETDHPERNGDSHVESVDLTEQQRKTLLAIYEDPDATQRELARRFEVSSATINTRVNSIDGFEWDNRWEFVNRMKEIGQLEPSTNGSVHEEQSAVHEKLDELATKVTTLERRLRDQRDASVFDDPALVHKVVHACITSERISEEEELRILQGILDS